MANNAIASRITEFQVTMPMTVQEYQVAQLYSVAQASKNETGGGEGIEVLANEPFDTDTKTGVQPDYPLLDANLYRKGQYTHKIYHLKSKVPGYIRLLAPKGALEIHEKAWNAFPYCRTVVSNPDYMKDGFEIKIETLHAPGNKTIENAHKLTGERLKKRTVTPIDIANDPVAPKDYKVDEDPTKYKSEKTGRGPLVNLNNQTWQDVQDPVMTCYKLVSCTFKWFGLQTKVESFIMKAERRIFNNFHRQVFCWTDRWIEMNMEDIRRLEDETKKELDASRAIGEVRGTVEKES